MSLINGDSGASWAAEELISACRYSIAVSEYGSVISLSSGSVGGRKSLTHDWATEVMLTVESMIRS